MLLRSQLEREWDSRNLPPNLLMVPGALSLVCLVRSCHANPGPIVIDARNALCIVAELSLGEVVRIARVSRNLS